MGKEGTGTSNENGEHLIEMCQANGLSLGETWFPHKDCQKVTWISPNGLTENQIDHFLVSNRWRSSLQDVRARRSADIGSDHHLVVGVMKLKLARAPRRKSGREKFDVKKLQSPEKRLRFQLELKNRFAVLPIEEVSLEQEWERIKSEHLETCKLVFGKIQRHRKQWITEETWRTIEERITAKEEVSKAKTRLQKQRAMVHYNEKVRDVLLFGTQRRRSHFSLPVLALIFPACSLVSSHLIYWETLSALLSKLKNYGFGLSTQLTPSSRREAWVRGNLTALTERSQLATRWTRGRDGESCVRRLFPWRTLKISTYSEPW